MLKTLALVGLVAYTAAVPTEDLVTSMPEMPNLNFTMYSGYLPLGNSTNSLHYLFAESQNNPATDPVLIWYNGGPGCSSMLAWAQEHGPWVMEDGGTIFHANEYSWNKFANMLYIEAPAGVGYSYCGIKEGCPFTDDSSADDNLDAIIYFFTQKFPEFQGNELYISGESYAGIYVPYVSYKID